MNEEMKVIKRDGDSQNMSFDKILNRLKNLSKGELHVNFTSLVVKIIDRLYDGISTSKIDELTAQQCASLLTSHPDYGELASRIVISNHQKNTEESFVELVNKLYTNQDIHGNHSPLVGEDLYIIVNEYKDEIQNMFVYERDFLFDYFGWKTLERAYLIKQDGVVKERPQHMWMRVALCIHGRNMVKVKETYNLMSLKYFTHATPTLFNAGTPRPQLSSCYLIAMEDDSIEGIYNTLSDCAKISKWAGGIGLHVHNIRGSMSRIRGTNGTSNGLNPMLQVFNYTARYVDQGGNKRNGSFAIYLEPWHSDVEIFLEMKKNHGDEETKARDLFYALWIPDLFMNRVKDDGVWSLFCPDECRDLCEEYGEAFEARYTLYEKEGRARKQIKARTLWFKILDSQIETGGPYILYKDSCNKKSNQQNLGTIKSSNLCTEIIEYSDENETAVCNLASVGLSKFVKIPPHLLYDVVVYTKKDCGWCLLLKNLLKKRGIIYEEREKLDEHATVPQLYSRGECIGGYDKCLEILGGKFDFAALHDVVKVITENLNNIIDINYYPTEKTKRSNFLHRPIGIGVQGLADVYAMMDLSFYSKDDDRSKNLNKKIFETIYHAAVEKSYEIAKERGEGLETLFKTHGKIWSFESTKPHCRDYIFHGAFDYYHDKDRIIADLKKYKPIRVELDMEKTKGAYSSFEGSPASEGKLQFDLWGAAPSNRYKWDDLKRKVKTYGMRNSLLVAPMPTASTSQILGNNECFEPFTSNIYVRRTIAGEFIRANRYLMNDMINMGMWDEDIKNSIIKNNGSVQHLTMLPKKMREKYLTVWEMPMEHLIEMAADRGIYICQSQSLNLWLCDPNYKSITSMHFNSWKRGLKTGMYYLRTKAKAAPQQFTIEPECESCSA